MLTLYTRITTERLCGACGDDNYGHHADDADDDA